MKITGILAVLLAVTLVAGSIFLLSATAVVTNGFCKQAIRLCSVVCLYTAAAIVVKAESSWKSEPAPRDSRNMAE